MTEISGPSGGGDLVVQRGDDVVGALMPMKVIVDDETVAGLMPNQVIRVPLAAGDHRVRAGRSHPTMVTMLAGDTVFVLAEHPPMPSRWRLMFDSMRATRPTVRVTSGLAPTPGPGQVAASQAWLEDWAPSFVSTGIWLRVAVGAVLVVLGSALAIVGRAEPVAIAIGVVIAVAGFVTVTIGLWLQGRVRRSGHEER